MVPSMVNDIYIIRFAVCAKYANDKDMYMAFNTIQKHADNVLAEYRAQRSGRQSSSNDSLDLGTKQPVNISNIEHDTAVAEETANPEAIPEVPTGPMIYPALKARVNDLI
jgi:hypothetical protein